MDLRDGPILVTGATGRQGGAVARHLLQHGYTVHALTRDGQQVQAQHLRDLGAKVVEGNLSDPETLKPLMQQVRGVYSVQNFWEHGAAIEVAQGRLVADLAEAYGLEFIVYSSVGGADRDTGIAHFDSKFQIEQHIRSLHVSWCLLRPVWFMENLLQPPLSDGLAQGKLLMPLPPEVRLQMVGVNDVGVFGALAFMNPGDWASTAFEIAGDEMTMPELAEALSVHLDRTITHEPPPLEQIRHQNEDAAVMYQWFIDAGYEAPIEQLRVLHPGLLNLRQWLHVVWPVPVKA